MISSLPEDGHESAQVLAPDRKALSGSYSDWNLTIDLLIRFLSLRSKSPTHKRVAYSALK